MLLVASCFAALASVDMATYNQNVKFTNGDEGNIVIMVKLLSAQIGDDNVMVYTATTDCPANYNTVEKIEAALESGTVDDIANAIGVAMGANIAGIWDILVGSAATLLAAWLSFLCRRIRIKGIPWLSLLWPVVVNAVIIGAELTLVTLGSWQWSGWCLFAAQVALGELIPSVAGGILLVKALENTRWGSSIFGE